MERIIDYQIAERPKAEELDIAVAKALKEGWQPYHGPYSDGYGHYQAMVKYAKGKKEK